MCPSAEFSTISTSFMSSSGSECWGAMYSIDDACFGTDLFTGFSWKIADAGNDCGCCSLAGLDALEANAGGTLWYSAVLETPLDRTLVITDLADGGGTFDNKSLTVIQDGFDPPFFATL